MRKPPYFTIMSNVLVVSAAIFCCLSLISHPVLGLGLTPATAPSSSTKPLLDFVNKAMNEAFNGFHSINIQQPNPPNRRERAALSDCSVFYNLSIIDLNQTLQTNLNPSPFDVQIWLSSALTNLDNCKTALTEQNVTNPTLQHNINNTWELITKCLVMNDHELKEESTGHEAYDELYRWFPDEDLLNLSEIDTVNDIVVAQDGSGNFRTIKEGLDAARTKLGQGRVSIYVKQGTYREYLEISADMKNILLAGDGIGKTIITGDRCAKLGFTTLTSSTVKVFGPGFVARDITFSNTGGAGGVNCGQAVALLSSSDQSAFYRCGFEGYQDTLWVNSNRQFYRECDIYGTIDFIFGNAAAVIQKSNIYARPPLPAQEVLITAQSRTAASQPTGISILQCTFLPDPKHKGELTSFQAYLGRPWRDYARVVYSKTSLDGMVNKEGWQVWNTDDPRNGSVYYAEYQNCGPGSSTSGRVKWKGFEVIEDVNKALKFSVENFINGQTWLPASGVPFSSGLSN